MADMQPTRGIIEQDDWHASRHALSQDFHKLLAQGILSDLFNQQGVLFGYLTAGSDQFDLRQFGNHFTGIVEGAGPRNEIDYQRQQPVGRQHAQAQPEQTRFEKGVLGPVETDCHEQNNR